MSFAKWLKYKLLRTGLILFAFVCLAAAGYSFLYFSGTLRTAAAGAGIAAAIISLVLSHYYKIKLQNLFFLPKKGEGKKLEE
jgi:hypothetical protein